MQYQSYKLSESDHALAVEITRETGLPTAHSIGCALQAWKRLPKKTQAEIAQRRHAERLKMDGRRLRTTRRTA